MASKETGVAEKHMLNEAFKSVRSKFSVQIDVGPNEVAVRGDAKQVPLASEAVTQLLQKAVRIINYLLIADY